MRWKALFKRWIFAVEPKHLIIRKGSVGSNTVFLTFDDGPHPEFTECILDILKRYGIRATFFMVGDAIARHPQIVRKVISLGHDLANHTHTHRQYSHLQFVKPFRELSQVDALLTKLTETVPTAIRPPYGKMTLAFLAYSLAKQRKIVMWSYDSMDSFETDTHQFLKRLSTVKDGDILLFHDDTEITAVYMEAVLQALIAKGFNFGLLSEVQQ